MCAEHFAKKMTDIMFFLPNLINFPAKITTFGILAF
jgi:hypothetical protein